MTSNATRLEQLIKTFSYSIVLGNSVIFDKGKIVEDSIAACSRKDIRGYFCSGLYKKHFLPLPILSKKPHLIITDRWAKNYYHWILEALTKLIVFKKKFPESKLILPSSYFKSGYILESLKAFEIKRSDIVKIPNKAFLFVKNLAFLPHINQKDFSNYSDLIEYSKIQDRLTSHFRKQFNLNFGERIYISRNNPKKKTSRIVVNEDEVEKILREKGFKTVYMEDFCFIDQMSIAYHAKNIVAVHGAGITNAVFAGKGSSLLELVNKKWLPDCYMKMAEKTGIEYDRILCGQPNEEADGTFSDIIVDTDLLKEKLKNL
jgi:capsular polysaccharide biosynthesis protein